MRRYSDGVTPYLILGFLCLVLYLPGLTSLPPVDRDEARFAQASRQMLESRDFVQIRFYEEPRNKKPIGVYWLQAAAAAVLAPSGSNPIWPFRIPSVLGATAAVLLIFAFGRGLFDDRTAMLGAALTAVSLVLMVEAHQATTDASLLATVVASQGALGRVYQRTRDGKPVGIGTALTFWLAQGVGVLIKGPVVPLVALLTAAGLIAADRSGRFLKGLRFPIGLPIAAAIVLPWAVAIYVATDGAFYRDAFTVDLLPKLVSGHESHGFPPGSYLLVMMLTFWPGSLFAWLALYNGWKRRSWTAERFCLAWLIPSWLVFELIPTKLPHYVMPMYPALALLTARAIFAGEAGSLAGLRSWAARAGFVVWSLIGLAVGGGIAAIPWLLNHRLSVWDVWVGAAGLLIAVVPAWFAFKGRVLKAALTAMGMAALILIPAFQTILPGVNPIWVSRAAAQAVERYNRGSAGPSPVVAAAGYHEPSLVFLLGTKTRLVSGEGAALYLRDHPEGLALVSDDAHDDFERHTSALGVAVRAVESIRGYNYTKGHWVTLTLYATGSIASSGDSGPGTLSTRRS